MLAGSKLEPILLFNLLIIGASLSKPHVSEYCTADHGSLVQQYPSMHALATSTFWQCFNFIFLFKFCLLLILCCE